MDECRPSEIERLQRETEEFLAWTEEHKRGFTVEELGRHVEILETSLQKNSLTEIVDHVRKDIELWIRLWWNHSKVGRTLDNGNRQSDRAEVIREFPKLLSGYFTILSEIQLNEPGESEETIPDQIITRIRESIEILLSEEVRGRAVHKKKKPPRKQPRGNK